MVEAAAKHSFVFFFDENVFRGGGGVFGELNAFSKAALQKQNSKANPQSNIANQNRKAEFESKLAKQT